MDDSMQPSGVTSVTADVHTEGLHCGQPSGSFEKSSHDAPVRLTHSDRRRQLDLACIRQLHCRSRQ